GRGQTFATRCLYSQPLTERCQNGNGVVCKTTAPGVHSVGGSTPSLSAKLLKERYEALRLYLRALFQYGLLQLGQTLGSPTVLVRGFQEWEQRLHLYP